MTKRKSWFSRRVLRFKREDDGSVSIEFVLWFPVFIALLMVVTDLTFIYTTNANMWDAARDYARKMSIRDMDAAEAKTEIESKGELWSFTGFVAEAVDGSTVVVEIKAPIRNASVFGMLDAVLDDDLVARVAMRREPPD